MKRNREKDSDGLLNAVKAVKLQRTDITKRLEAGRTIQLTLKTKAQLLTIISDNEGQDTLNHSLILEEGRTLTIVLIADPFAPEVSMYVFTAEKT